MHLNNINYVIMYYVNLEDLIHLSNVNYIIMYGVNFNNINSISMT